jgi:spore maturation protein A
MRPFVSNLFSESFIFFSIGLTTGGMIMVMSWIWSGMLALSLIGALFSCNGTVLAGAAMEGAQKGVSLAIAMAGAICLWSGVGELMEKTGISRFISALLRPVLGRLFPSTRSDPALKYRLSANVCANLLGLGNAATPMGIQAAQRLAKGAKGIATDELCRLVVLNTASIQLLPTNVAAVRSSLGCAQPFDILPAVWVTSLCSAGLGVLAAWLLGRLWRR